MKRVICVLFLLVVCVPFGLGKVDFTKPAPVRVFTPLDRPALSARTVANKTGSTSKKSGSSHRVPANVIPIGMEVNFEDGGVSFQGCSAFRLTPTLMLTAAHCLVDYFPHGTHMYAEPSQKKDGQWMLKFINDEKPRPRMIKPNARVIFYRPSYQADGTRESHAFDFALVKLDNSLRFNQAGLTAQFKNMEADLALLPPDMQEGIKDKITATAKEGFNKEAAIYKKFLQQSLETYDLLQMDPAVVVDELKNDTIHAYFWPGEENSTNRGDVEVFSGYCMGTDTPHQNSHTLLFNTHTKPGTSGSPFLITKRKLIVSVDSGPMGTGVDSGGLISAEVCTWVKSHDPSVKCLVVESNSGAIDSETSATAAWGR